LASITDSSSGRAATTAEKSAPATRQFRSTAISRSVQPERAICFAGSRTQGCSIADTATMPGLRTAAAPLMKRLLASEPPLVKITSVGCAPAA
jgi:hypothetical protein